jgi:hypothetical protein
MMELGSASLFSVASPSHPYSKGVLEIAAQLVKPAGVG